MLVLVLNVEAAAAGGGNTALEAWAAGIRVSRRKLIQKWILRLGIAAYL